VSPIRVLICDDAAAFSILAAQWIANSPDLEAVGTVRSGPELLEVLGPVAPDVVVLDHLLGDLTSEELTPMLRALDADVAVLLVSGMPADVLEGIAQRSGVDSFVSKATRPDEFCEAIRRVGRRTRH
jgi:DNA-binding NarL/FixJ family response regulator